MERKIIITKDGSKTIHLPEWNENYHSHHGAIQEALHVFINSGLKEVLKIKKNINILEIGFGTGLNFLLTVAATYDKDISVHYDGIEAFPISKKEFIDLNYVEIVSLSKHQNTCNQIINTPWNKITPINKNLKLNKQLKTFESFQPKASFYDLIYFDAFGPRVQPELWTIEGFQKLFYAMQKQGIFVTYCCKGQVRRDLIKTGFQVEKIPGPPGKREMLRAIKPE